MRRLIVNADDFGLTAGVNRSIAQLHQRGVLTSATLMARALAAEEALHIARSTSSLGVGCHVVLVDGEPALPASQIPTLVDPATGRFHPTLGAFLPRLLSGRIRTAEIEAEACAQIERLRAAAIHPTHLDTHKHTHMFWPVLEPVLRAARAQGVCAIRNPFEPAWSLAATPGAPLVRRVQVHILRQMQAGFLRRVRHAGLRTTDGAVGVLATGTLDQHTVASLLTALPPGTWELVAHPGYNDQDLQQARTRLLASRELEQQALAAVAEFPALSLIHFGQL